MTNSKTYSNSWHPDVIPIVREEGYHTHYIGHTADGRQFFGLCTFANPEIMPSKTDDWRKLRKEYVVLFLFDANGSYIETKHWLAGTADQVSDQELYGKLNEMIAKLGNVTYNDIRVKPFSTVIDGITFGLIPNEEYQTIDMEPSSTMSFHEPRDGYYDT